MSLRLKISYVKRLEKLLKKGKSITPPSHVAYSKILRNWGGFVTRFKIQTIIVVLMVTGIALWYGKSKTWFDANFLNCEPKGLESIELQDDIVEAFQQSQNTSFFTVPNLDSAYRITTYLEKQGPVASVESPSTFCTPEQIQKRRRALVEKIRKKSAEDTPFIPVDVQAFKSETERLEANIVEMSQLAYQSVLDRFRLLMKNE